MEEVEWNVPWIETVEPADVEDIESEYSWIVHTMYGTEVEFNNFIDASMYFRVAVDELRK